MYTTLQAASRPSVSDETNHYCLITKFHNVVGAGSGYTVMCERTKQHRSQDTVLMRKAAEMEEHQ